MKISMLKSIIQQYHLCAKFDSLLSTAGTFLVDDNDEIGKFFRKLTWLISSIFD